MAQEPTATPVWLNAAPANEVVDLWQVSQVAVVAMWLVDFPLAVVPLWQVAQPVAMPVWFMVAAVNEVVFLWQESHDAVVGICDAGLPLAVLP